MGLDGAWQPFRHESSAEHQEGLRRWPSRCQQARGPAHRLGKSTSAILTSIVCTKEVANDTILSITYLCESVESESRTYPFLGQHGERHLHVPLLL